ncbi:MAG TPA: hypothetical protein VF701_21780 [Thermoanaerobaculia bacterium]
MTKYWLTLAAATTLFYHSILLASPSDIRGTATDTEIVLMVAGHVPGGAGSRWETDIRLVNQTSSTASVNLEFFPSGSVGNTAPALSRQVEVLAHQQTVLNRWTNIFPGAEPGIGAIRVISDHPIVAVARVYNDQRPQGGGTFGQFVPGIPAGMARTTGVLPMLAHQEYFIGKGGFRTNIGWFNNSAHSVTLTLRVHMLHAVLVTVTREIAPFSQLQLPIGDIFGPTLEPWDQLHVTFEATEPGLHVYASVVDNVTNDPIFVPAQ